jgi:selenocysteine-specific elongation factor
MPQTREHLAIMQILGVRRGLIALTKIDMVEPEMVALAADDIRAATRGTFLEHAPLLPVSSLSGAGLDEFKRVLFRLASETVPRSDGGIFRMPVQRVFSAKGFGTVVTGIPVSGAVSIGDVVEVLPTQRACKVRSIQAYSENTSRARAGHSSAINLTDLAVHEVTRGHVIATPGFFRPTRMVAATFEAIATLEHALEDRLAVRLHTGTAEAVGELVLLDRERLEPGASALVQLRLTEPVVCAPGDRFVLRLASPVVTLGGGSILEESKYRLKRFKKFVLEELERAADSLASPRELLDVALVRWSKGIATLDDLAVEIKRSREDTERLLSELKSGGRVRPFGKGGWIHGERLSAARKTLTEALGRWFTENPHRSVVDVRDARRLTGMDDEFLAALLEFEAREKTLELQAGGLIRPLGRAAEADSATEEAARLVHAMLAKIPFQPPAPAELAAALKLPEKRLRAVLELLVDRGEVQRVQSDLLLTRENFDKARAAVIANCQKNGSLDIPSLRDELSTSRKFLIPLLEHFDATGVTLRQGANRVLRKR